MRDDTERGFTLIEIMAVVVILGILAAVVIPNFMAGATKAKRRSEVSAMFAEITVKQEAFKTERGYYMGDATVATYFNGTTSCPTTAAPTTDYAFAATCIATGNAWAMLRIDPPQSTLRCKYTITAGLSGTSFTPPSGFKNSQNAVAAEAALAGNWYYITAECDERGNGGTNATYFKSSVDGKLQYQNEGT